jgi:hypothetical protein
MQFSQEESVLVGVGFTTGIITTTCLLQDVDLLTTKEARLFMKRDAGKHG